MTGPEQSPPRQPAEIAYPTPREAVRAFLEAGQLGGATFRLIERPEGDRPEYVAVVRLDSGDIALGIRSTFGPGDGWVAYRETAETLSLSLLAEKHPAFLLTDEQAADYVAGDPGLVAYVEGRRVLDQHLPGLWNFLGNLAKPSSKDPDYQAAGHAIRESRRMPETDHEIRRRTLAYLRLDWHNLDVDLVVQTLEGLHEYGRDLAGLGAALGAWLEHRRQADGAGDRRPVQKVDDPFGGRVLELSPDDLDWEPEPEKNDPPGPMPVVGLFKGEMRVVFYHPGVGFFDRLEDGTEVRMQDPDGWACLPFDR